MGLPRERRAFTVVELMVTLGIITILVGLLLPAVQAARESARRMECQSNLRQVALASLNHQTAFAHFPAGGFGYRWVGDSELGVGVGQPGGWIFSSLPFMEQQALFDRSRSSINLENPSVFEAPIPLLVCPSRGQSGPTQFWGQTPFFNAFTPAASFKSDYAGNGGDRFFPNTPGPLDERC